MLRRLRVPSPYLMLRHPIFQYETRRIRWSWSTERLWAYTRAIVIVMHLFVFVTWLLLLGVWWLAKSDYPYRDNEVFMTSLAILYLGMALSIFAGAILDFVSLQSGLKTISGEQLAGRWELLRLTALTDAGIIRAKHETVRLRTWRVTSVLMGLRVALVTMIAFATAILPYVVLGYNEVVDGIVEGLTTDPLSVLLVGVTTVITLLVYVLEPFWRMHGMTALGMVLSAHITNIPLATLAAVGTIFAVSLLQTIIVFALFMGLGWLGSLTIFSQAFVYGDSTYFPFFAYLLFCCIVTALTVYGFYQLMKTWSLRRVLHRLERMGR